MVFVISTGTTNSITRNHLVQYEKKSKCQLENNYLTQKNVVKRHSKKKIYMTYRKQNGKSKFSFVCNFIEYECIKLYN